MRLSRSCPVCHTSSDRAELFLDENIDRFRISEFSFASRKEPEFMCHRLVRCCVCDLVYVDKPPGEGELAEAYHAAKYDSSEEAEDAAAAYIRAIQPTLAQLQQHQDALEIGAGTGIFLEYLARENFNGLVGVEPSCAAIAAAPQNTRSWLREGMFAESDFHPNSFDLICCFMTMEHVRDPLVIASASHRLLRPGGAFVTVTHDYRSAINRLLGRHSPIVDVEHMQLFSKRSVKYLFEACNYHDVKVNPFRNNYALRYWVRLMPMPPWAKRFTVNSLAIIGLDKIKVSLNVGNLIAAGIKRT